MFEMKSPSDVAKKPKPFASSKEIVIVFMMVVSLAVVLGYSSMQKASIKIDKDGAEASRDAEIFTGDDGDAPRPVLGGAAPPPPGGDAEPVGGEAVPPDDADGGEAAEGAEDDGDGDGDGDGRDPWLEDWLKKQKADFRPMADEFDRVEKIDMDLLFSVIDDMRMPEVTGNIRNEAPVFYNVISFLRSHTPEELRAMANPDVGWSDLIQRADENRGAVVRLDGQYVREYQLQRWTTPEVRTNSAGLNDTWILFVKDVHTPGAVYAVLTASDDKKEFRSNDLVRGEAVFVKRWCGMTQSGTWRWLPLVVVTDLRKMNPPSGGTAPASWFIAAVAALGVVVLFFAAMREFRKAAESSKHQRELRKQTKKRIQEQLKKNREEDAQAEAEAVAEKAEDESKGSDDAEKDD